jgi:hypothetical protein
VPAPPNPAQAGTTGAQPTAVSKAVSPKTGTPPAIPATPANAPATGTATASGDRKTADASLPALSFENLKLLVVDGKRSREQDAIVHLSDGRIIIIAVGERLVATLPYADVLTLSSSRSRQPRWRNANGTESGSDLGGGAFGFLKSDRTWLAIQTKDHTYVVRSARDEIAPLARAASERTGLPVVNVSGK